MLVLNDIRQGIPLAQELEQRGVVLQPKTGPLSVLVSESGLAVALAERSPNDAVDYGGIVSSIYETAQSTSGLASVSVAGYHDIKMDEISDLVSTAILAIVGKARGIVKPIVTEIEESLGQQMMSYEDRGLVNVAIDELGVHEVIDDDNVFDYFEEFKGHRLTAVRGVRSLEKMFPALDDTNIATLIESGSQSINDFLIQEFSLTSDGIMLGRFVYENFFRGTEGNIERARQDMRIMFGYEHSLYGLMLVHYMAIGLKENLPDGVEGSIGLVESVLDSIKNQTGLLIYSELKHFRDSLKEKKLLPYDFPVVDGPNGKNDGVIHIRVNRDVYHNFLADGGTPDAIIGAMLSKGSTNYNIILDNKDKYEKRYEDYVNVVRSNTAVNRLDFHRMVISSTFRKIHANNEELRLAAPTNNGVFIRLDNYLRRMSQTHISTPENLYRFLCSMVSNVVFPDDPSVEKVLADIDNFKTDGEEMDVSKMASFVMIDLIVEWLVKQITVKGSGVNAGV